MTTTTGRRSFAPAFKADAVARVRRAEESVATIATDLGVSASTLRTWVRQADAALEAMPPPEALAPQPDPHGCMICGRGPAAEVTFRSVIGMILAFKWSKVQGRLCHDCGIAAGRDTLNRTMLTGWWGFISFFFNVYAVGVNLVGINKVEGLAPPTGEPARPPLKPVAPMRKRPGLYVTLAVFVAIGGYFGLRPTGAERWAGKCITFNPAAATEVRSVDCGSAHEGKVVAVKDNPRDCPTAAEGTIRLKSDGDKVLCVDTDA